jgi:hypothetical protein
MSTEVPLFIPRTNKFYFAPPTLPLTPNASFTLLEIEFSTAAPSNIPLINIVRRFEEVYANEHTPRCQRFTLLYSDASFFFTPAAAAVAPALASRFAFKKRGNNNANDTYFFKLVVASPPHKTGDNHPSSLALEKTVSTFAASVGKNEMTATVVKKWVVSVQA